MGKQCDACEVARTEMLADWRNGRATVKIHIRSLGQNVKGNETKPGGRRNGGEACDNGRKQDCGAGDFHLS